MNCLKCGNQMESGFLKSNTEIHWTKNQYFDASKKESENIDKNNCDNNLNKW